MRSPTCSICGLAEPVVDTSLCLDCAAIRRHKFTDRTILVVDGSWEPGHPTIGGAGIVLVDGGPAGEVVGQRYCGFGCHGSQDAEYEAILRAHRWAPQALIYSDALFVVRRLQGYRRTRATIGQQVRFLRRAPHLRGDAYHRAHSLSVQGRQTFVNQEALREQRECPSTQCLGHPGCGDPDTGEPAPRSLNDPTLDASTRLARDEQGT